MSVSDFEQIRDRLRQLYLEDPRPWLVGFSGGKDSMLVSALVFETVLSVPAANSTRAVRTRRGAGRMNSDRHRIRMSRRGKIGPEGELRGICVTGNTIHAHEWLGRN